MDSEYVVGLDLGGTKLASAIFRKTDKGIEFVYGLENRKYDVIFGGESELDAREKSERIEEAMVYATRELSEFAGVQPVAVGVCTAGFVENGIVEEAYNTGMKRHPLRDNLRDRTGAPVYLYKDSWAPVYALRPARPAIIFSIGTGFGGVSCEPDLSIPLRSYTAARFPTWLPFLCANDDPGYAVTFSEKLSARLIERGVERANGGPLKGNPVCVDGGSAVEWASLLSEKAREEKRLSPSRLELGIMKLFAREAAGRFRPAEVYADVPGAATFPPLVYLWITGKRMEPPELDELLAGNDPEAVAAFYIQSEFIGYILYKMQKERLRGGLQPAELVYATGSGYNPATHRVLSRPVMESMMEQCAERGVPGCGSERVEYLDVPGGAPTTLACYGAAMGAARGV